MPLPCLHVPCYHICLALENKHHFSCISWAHLHLSYKVHNSWHIPIVAKLQIYIHMVHKISWTLRLWYHAPCNMELYRVAYSNMLRKAHVDMLHTYYLIICGCLPCKNYKRNSKKVKDSSMKSTAWFGSALSNKLLCVPNDYIWLYTHMSILNLPSSDASIIIIQWTNGFLCVHTHHHGLLSGCVLLLYWAKALL